MAEAACGAGLRCAGTHQSLLSVPSHSGSSQYRVNEGRVRSMSLIAIYRQSAGIGAAQPLHTAPFLPCHTRFVPQRSQINTLFIVAQQCWHEYLRLPALAAFTT